MDWRQVRPPAKFTRISVRRQATTTAVALLDPLPPSPPFRLLFLFSWHSAHFLASASSFPSLSLLPPLHFPRRHRVQHHGSPLCTPRLAMPYQPRPSFLAHPPYSRSTPPRLFASWPTVACHCQPVAHTSTCRHRCHRPLFLLAFPPNSPPTRLPAC